MWINFRHASLFQTGPLPQIDNNKDNFIKLVLNLRKMVWKLWILNILSKRLLTKFFIRVAEFILDKLSGPKSTLSLSLDKNFGAIQQRFSATAPFISRPQSLIFVMKPSADYAIQNARYMTLEGDHFPFTGICYEIVVWTAQFWFLGLFILNIVTVIFGNLLEVN